MSLSFSTGLRTFTAAYGSYKQALQGGKMRLYSGSVPATADAALVSGYTLLNQITLASGALTEEVCAAGSVTVAGSSGTVTSITVDGKEILGVTCAYVDSPANLATLIANTINAYAPILGAEYIATTSSAKVIITALPGSGTSANGLVVSTTVTGSVTKTDVNMGTEVAGVSGVNGITYGGATAGVLAKGTGIWSGTNLATGTATYFRICGSVADGGALSTSLIRIQGTCGISGSDYVMSSTTLTLGYTHTVDGFSLTVSST